MNKDEKCSNIAYITVTFIKLLNLISTYSMKRLQANNVNISSFSYKHVKTPDQAQIWLHKYGL